MNRRQLVTNLGAALCCATGTGHAQSRPRRVGLMSALPIGDPETALRLGLFRKTLADAGWREGQNLAIEFAWYGSSSQAALDLARKFIDQRVDVVLANGAPALDALTKLGATLPVVFVLVTNPVGAGYVSNLSRPGANITGFSTFEPELAGKWLQLLKQVVPAMKSVNMLLEPKFPSFNSLWQEIAALAPRQGIEPRAAFTSNVQEIEAALGEIAKQDNPGLIIAPNPVSTANRKRIIELANANRIPAICPFRFYLKEGALITYGFQAGEQFRRAADYVDRILKGEKAGDLPVQAPSVFELGLNLRTARAIGLTIPQQLLVAADEVVE